MDANKEESQEVLQEWSNFQKQGLRLNPEKTLISQVVSSKQPKRELTQELSFSRISESTTGYIFTPCVRSFTSPGIDTR